ncbi:DUF4292 domain-containing protein [Parapedobacter sp. 2B3]|uniref:DUF4292 domain-containing protein n=1 Tax=Parapedobacter sp. 2B3 TaxID=3342381 RepID=UPI0035B638C9
MLSRWAGLCLVLVFSLSCGPKKRMVPAGDSEIRVPGAARRAVMSRVAQQQLHYSTFSGRAKSSLTINGKERYDVTANVRIVRDEAIWISVTALMGIEVARVFITPDSIRIVNRLQAAYIKKPFEYLRDFTGSGLDFPSLERLLVGDVIDQVAGDDLEVWKGRDGYLLQRQVDDMAYTVRVDTAYRNRHTSIAEPVRDQRLEAFYSDYQATTRNPFPHQMDISIVAPRFTLQSEVKYSRVLYDENVELPFSVPSRYTEIQ